MLTLRSLGTLVATLALAAAGARADTYLEFTQADVDKALKAKDYARLTDYCLHNANLDSAWKSACTAVLASYEAKGDADALMRICNNQDKDWLTFIGFHLTFLVQHWLGNQGMPRRYADYLPSDGFTTLNMVSTAGALVLGLSTLPFLWNVFRSYRYGEVVTVDDPWGFGNSLEWATSCPPPRHNFTELPRIRSERPAFELHYPHMIERLRAEAHAGSGGH